MFVLERIKFMLQLNPAFLREAVRQIPQDKIWHMNTWMFLMGGEL